MRRVLRHPLVWGTLSIALLALVAWRSRAWEIGDRLASADPRPIVVAIALNGLIATAWAIRSSDLLTGAGRPVGWIPLLPMTAFANTINNITPGSVGELVRLYLLRAHHGVDYTTGAAVVVVERVVAIAYLGASAAVAWAAWSIALPVPLTIGLLVAIAALPGIAYAAGLRPSRFVVALPLQRLIGAGRWVIIAAAVRRLDETVAMLLRSPRRAAAFAAWTSIIFAAYTAQLVLVGSAIGVEIDPVAAWGALGLGIVAGVLSLLPFGLGSADVVVVALLVASGVPAQEAALIAFGYRLVSTLPLGIIGIASYAVLSVSLPDGRPMAAAGLARAELAANPDVLDTGRPPTR